MGRILSIDYGKKRTGIAVTDPLKIIANGLTTVNTHELQRFLDTYISKEDVEKVIVGHPKRFSGEDSEIMVDIKKFLTGFNERYPNLPVELYDERFTSKMAVNAMIEGGLKKKKRQNKKLVDKIAATILLQNYMEELANR